MRAIVLSGGGAKGAVQVGCMQEIAFQEFKRTRGTTGPVLRVDGKVPLPWKIYAGVSTGALQAAGACGGTWEDMYRLRGVWEGISGNQDVFLKRAWGLLRLLSGKGESLYDSRPLEKLIARAFEPQRAIAAKNTLLVGSVSLRTGRYFVATERHPEIRQFVLASASMPCFFPGYLRGPERIVDGGLRNITPLADAIRAGATDIDVILASPLKIFREEKTLRSIKDIALRSLSILTNEIFVSDLRECLARNQNPRPGDRVITVRVHQPPIHLSESLEFTRTAVLTGLNDVGPRMAHAPQTPEQAIAGFEEDA